MSALKMQPQSESTPLENAGQAAERICREMKGFTANGHQHVIEALQAQAKDEGKLETVDAIDEKFTDRLWEALDRLSGKKRIHAMLQALEAAGDEFGLCELKEHKDNPTDEKRVAAIVENLHSRTSYYSDDVQRELARRLLVSADEIEAEGQKEELDQDFTDRFWQTIDELPEAERLEAMNKALAIVGAPAMAEPVEDETKAAETIPASDTEQLNPSDQPDSTARPGNGTVEWGEGNKALADAIEARFPEAPPKCINFLIEEWDRGGGKGGNIFARQFALSPDEVMEICGHIVTRYGNKEVTATMSY